MVGCRLRVAVLVCFVLGAVAPAAAYEVKECGDVVPTGHVGVLRRDLVCSGVAVFLGGGAKLDLSSHSITMDGPVAGPDGLAVQCRGRCVVRGPGRIVNAGLGVSSRYRAGVKNVRFEGCTRALVVMNDSEYACGVAARAARVTVVGGTGVAIESTWVTATQVKIRGQGGGINGRSVRLDRVTIEGSAGTAIRGNTVYGTRIAVRDSGGAGIRAERVWLTHSTLTRNGRLGASEDADLLVADAVRLGRVTCDRSTVASFFSSDPPTGSWGLCRQDPAPHRSQRLGPPRWRRELGGPPVSCPHG